MAKVYRMVREPVPRGKPGAVRWKRTHERDARGAWFIDYQSADGRRVRKATEATTKREAEDLLHARLSENAKASLLGVQSSDSWKPIVFRDFWTDDYLPVAKTRDRASTIERKEVAALHLLKFFGSRTLRGINAGHVETYVKERMTSAAKPRPATVNWERSLLSGVLNAAFRRGFIDVNPVARVRPMHEDNALDLWLKPEQVDLILEKAEAWAWVRPFIVLAVHTGMREGELAELAWENLSHSPGWIRVGQDSKSHKARFIPVNKAVKEVLKHQSRFIADGKALPWVFVNPRRKKAYKGASIYHDFCKARKLAAEELAKRGDAEGARDVAAATFHTLRHTFASWAIQAGIPLAEVQQYLGHSSDHLTRRYAHLAPKPVERRNVLDALVKDGRFLADGVARKAGAL